MFSSSSTNYNFPENLAIVPSSPYLPNDHNEQDVFGSKSQEQAILRYGIAGRVWEAAYAMASYVLPPPQWEFLPPFATAIEASSDVRNPLTIIELGSGNGMLACLLANKLNPAKDMLIPTDLPEVCDLLESNLHVQCRKFKLVQTRPLPWGNYVSTTAIADEFFRGDGITTRTLTHIICSDLVYFPQLHAPLLRTLLYLSSPPFTSLNTVKIVISYKTRSLPKELPFWSAFGLWFEYEPVIQKSSVHSDWERFGAQLDDKIYIFIAHRRPQSFAWSIPTTDDHLLNGVGAWGTETEKNDDTFEALLLMELE